MDTPATNLSRGEVEVTLGGKARRVRFGMTTLRDYSLLTGSPVAGFALDLTSKFQETLLNISFCAIKRYVPAAELPENFDINMVGDWLDDLSEADGELLAEALFQSVKTGNPMLAALMNKIVPPTTPSTETPSTPEMTAGTSS
jgi:hypothetical protein